MPGSRGAIVGSTTGDTRDILIEGDSGILACSPPWFMPIYQPSKRKVVWPNGSMASTFGAELPERLRGPQFHWAICDEIASWRTGSATYDMLMLGLRLGDDPKCAIATTPKAVPHLKAILHGQHTVVTRSTTYENLCNLAEPWAEEIITRYEGTRLGRQELLAELLEDSENALWKRKDIDDHRADHHPDLPYIVVGVDPSITSYGNEAGIIVAGRTSGRGRATQFYVLDDRSLRASPHGWATAVVAAYNKHQADMVIAESNQGGEMVSQTIKSVKPDIPVRLIQATRGKRLRAEPVAALYEVGRVHHCGLFPELESEMCLWEPGIGESPNRLDALAHALQALSRTNLGWARGPMAA